MRVTLLAAAVGFSLCALPFSVHAQKQIQVYASIVDASGAPVSALEPGDVRVTENGAEAKITKMEPVNWPVKVQILLDNGVGLGNTNIGQLRTGVTGLLDALPENLEVTLVSTAPQPRFLTKPTTDRAAMKKGVDLLGPDGGAGRFVEAISEATQRIEKDKSDHFPVIIVVGTTSGDRDVRESDIERMMARLEQKPTTVHVVLYSGGSQSSTGGANQTQVGLSVTKYTGGRYENINSVTRMATLLPELGAQVAKTIERQSRQFRITADRPAGASGEITKVGMGARSPLVVAGVSLNGRLP
jgi:hypothetical protein